MRLLSFLSDIERSLATDANTSGGQAWEISRMVNFHHGLARLTLKPRAGASATAPSGTVFLQSFTLADGSLCLKASLNWKGSDSLGVVAVYSTPTLNWKNEATRIASTWLQGPPSGATIHDINQHAEESHSLTAMAS